MESHKITRLSEEQQKAVEQTDQKINVWSKFKDDYVALKDRLLTLPDKITHDVMVPFGSLAFMPGQLIHTNEVLVLLGDNWFVDRSAKQAAEIVERRISGIDKNLSELHQQRELLSGRLSFTEEFKEVAENKDILEITEEYDPEKEKAWKEQHRKRVQEHRKQLTKKEMSKPTEQTAEPTIDELFARLDELHLQEIQGREMESIEQDEPSTEQSKATRNSKARVHFEGDQSDSSSEQTSDSSLGNATDSEDSEPSPRTILFSHSKNTEATGGASTMKDETSETEDITSPADIYRRFSPRGTASEEPKSILKPARICEEPAQKIERQILPCPEQAFSGTIVERPVGFESENKMQQKFTENPAGHTTKRVSKFKAQRQNQKQ